MVALGKELPVEAVDELDRRLELVSAWCERACAEGWSSGRLSYPAEGPMPFADEVAALLGRSAARASDLLHAARARVETLQRRARAAAPAWSRLERDFGLSPLALDVLCVVCAPFFRGELARVYAIIANDPGRPLCDELLVCQILGDGVARHAIAAELHPRSPLVLWGIVQVGSDRRPFQDLQPHPDVVRRLAGEDFHDADPDDVVEPYRAPPPGRPALAPAGLQARLARAFADAAARVVVRGRPGSGRRTLLALAAQTARLGVIDVSRLPEEPAAFAARLQQALRSAVLRGWLPCVTGFDGLAAASPPLVQRLREALRAHPGPLTLRCGPETRPPLAPGFALFDLPPLREGERAACWRSALASHALDTGAAEALAARYAIGPGTISGVTARVAARGVDDLAADLAAELTQQRHTRLSEVATRVTRLAEWSELVLPPDVLDILREFVGRVRHRRQVHEDWGFERVLSTTRGLSMLLQGAPGTGKTMIAGVLARELGAELYRIDLSRILSKWIGETERNLGTVFDAAEDGQTILLFDEADALFGKRTEVKSANDRYANAEVNYLLQRLDSFEGIAILTTNLAASLDSAFKRRLSLRVTLPFPDEKARAELWRAHLPPALPTEGPLQLAALAARYSLSGGHIRNAALRAAFLAAEERSALTQGHLERAVQLEYREAGRITEGGAL